MNFEDLLKKYKNENHFLILANPRSINKESKEFTKSIDGDGLIIYLSTVSSYKKLLSLYKDKEIFIIDTTSRNVDENIDNVVGVNHPNNLTDMSLIMTTVFNAYSSRKIVIIDNLSVLLIYNSIEKISHFLRWLNQKCSSDNCILIFFISDETDIKLIRQSKVYFKVVRI